MKNRKFDFRTAYIDLLINLLTGIVTLFLLSTLLLTTQKNERESIKKNAQFIITAEWPKDVDCDVDLWVRDPDGRLISFQRKENGIIYLERDDMGKRKDNLTRVENGQIVDALNNPDNKEFATVRGLLPGKYVVNIHLYSCFISEQIVPTSSYTPMVLPTKVELIKLNPNVVTIKSVDLQFNKTWEELTAFSFEVDDKGNVKNITESFVPIMPMSPVSSGVPYP